MIKGFNDIDDHNPDHIEAMNNTVSNFGMEGTINKDATPSTKFYQLWNLHCCDGQMTETEAEEGIAGEFNMWLELNAKEKNNVEA